MFSAPIFSDSSWWFYQWTKFSECDLLNGPAEAPSPMWDLENSFHSEDLLSLNDRLGGDLISPLRFTRTRRSGVPSILFLLYKIKGQNTHKFETRFQTWIYFIITSYLYTIMSKVVVDSDGIYCYQLNSWSL